MCLRHSEVIRIYPRIVILPLLIVPLLMPLSSLSSQNFVVGGELSGTIRAGESATFRIVFMLMGATPETVYLYGPYAAHYGMSVSFSENPVRLAARFTYVYVYVSTSRTTPPGRYGLPIKVFGESGEASVYISLEVLPPRPVFSVSLSPKDVTVYRGDMANFTVTVTPYYGFSGPVKLICTNCPPNSFTPNPIAPPYSSLLSINTTNVVPGTYWIRVEGCSEDTCYRGEATLTVLNAPLPEEMKLITYPPTLVGRPGNDLKVDVTVSVLGGKCPYPLTLKVHAPPEFYFYRYPTTFNGTSSFQLWFTIPRNAAPGTYDMYIELYREGRKLLKRNYVKVIVNEQTTTTEASTTSALPELSILITPEEVVLSKKSPEAQITITVNSTGGKGDVNISLMGLPPEISYSAPPKLIAGQSGLITLTLESERGEGNYTVSVLAVTNGASAKRSFNLRIEAPQMNATQPTVTVTRTVTSERISEFFGYSAIAVLVLLAGVLATLLLPRRGHR
ncbi:MAG: hypothetical protein QW418_03855 [Candidatus Korarchaeum sp.]